MELEVQYATHKIRRPQAEEEYDEVELRSFNGTLGGPVLEVRPGDTLEITLTNNLPYVESMVLDHPHNGPHGFNVTNLYFHGLHASAAGNANNPMLEIGPGQSFHYEIKIPHDHPAGTYWYHAQKHGAVGIQIGSGMSGALIIRGDIDELPALKAARERILVLQQIPYQQVESPYHEGKKANMVEEFTQVTEARWDELVKQGRRVTLNGEVEPTFELRPGEVQRWRLIHAGLHAPLQLALVRIEGDQEVALSHYQIALDGITTGRRDRVQQTELYPGYRADVLVHAVGADGTPLPVGTYWLVDARRGASDPARRLACVEVAGEPVEMALPSEDELAPLAPFETIEESELDGQVTQLAIFEAVTGKEGELQFQINGKLYDHHGPPRSLQQGAVQEWLVASMGAEHPGGNTFHLPVNPFQIRERVMDNTGRILSEKVVWKDTLHVPPGGSVLVSTRYQRYLGTFALLDQNPYYQDLGTMEKLELVPPGPSQGGGHAH